VTASDTLNVDFKAAMRRLASGVGVLTAHGPEGPVGMAATSITSLTAEPPAILVCVNRSASIHACLSEGERFCVNLLSRHQSEVSAAFGSSAKREERFSVGHWSHDAEGLPWLEEAQANLSCRVAGLVPYATHSIVIGEVSAVRVAETVSPLIYQDGGYL
jgi:flavin reductase (DIM6/NTAB) family NADH-FMN oxidoreductase RutF